MRHVALQDLTAQTQSIAKLFKTGDYSDLTIVCGNDHYKVHKSIVCSRSPFFKKACNGKFKESQTSEVKLDYDDPIAVRMMIEYLYLLTYTPPLKNIHDSTINADLSPTSYSDKRKSDMELWGESFVGNKRIRTLNSSDPSLETPTCSGTSTFREGMPQDGEGAASLSSHVTQPTQSPGLGFDPIPTTNPPSASPPASGPNQPPAANLCLHVKVYSLGEKYGIEHLKMFAVRRFEAEVESHLQSIDFLLAIEEAYTSTIEEDRGLRDAIVRTLKKHKDLLKKDYLQELVKSTQLGYDLVMKFACEEEKK
ncbi:hypothetical protein DER45DRAFT_615683 [Fusarium avenaceum]|nr:hypothetical protein DER45DRAFT_615683 [Fusarium avenaceum]